MYVGIITIPIGKKVSCKRSPKTEKLFYMYVYKFIIILFRYSIFVGNNKF